MIILFTFHPIFWPNMIKLLLDFWGGQLTKWAEPKGKL